ncbi:hypothetical protein ACNKHU_16175 [Shigella flexneri]
MVIYTDTLLHYSPENRDLQRFLAIFDEKYTTFLDLLSGLYHGKFRRFVAVNIHATFAMLGLPEILRILGFKVTIPIGNIGHRQNKGIFLLHGN